MSACFSFPVHKHDKGIPTKPRCKEEKGTPITHIERERRRQNALIFNLIANKSNQMPRTTTTLLEPRNCSRLVDYSDLFILRLHLMGIKSFSFWENLWFFKDFSIIFLEVFLYFCCWWRCSRCKLKGGHLRTQRKRKNKPLLSSLNSTKIGKTSQRCYLKIGF